MPTKPLSHVQRLRQTRAPDRSYNQTVRKLDPTLAEAQRLRNTARWHKLRKMKLAQQPLCEDPYARHAGQTVPATEVDHIQGLRTHPHLAFVDGNLQSLCFTCHARKSAAERRSWSLFYVKRARKG